MLLYLHQSPRDRNELNLQMTRRFCQSERKITQNFINRSAKIRFGFHTQAPGSSLLERYHLKYTRALWDARSFPHRNLLTDERNAPIYCWGGGTDEEERRTRASYRPVEVHESRHLLYHHYGNYPLERRKPNYNSWIGILSS